MASRPNARVDEIQGSVLIGKFLPLLVLDLACDYI